MENVDRTSPGPDDADAAFSLNLFYMNIQGLNSKVPELEVLLETGDANFTFVCLTEHFIPNDLEGVYLAGFCPVSGFCRSRHIHGGVAIFSRLSESCNCTPLDLDAYNSEINCEVAGVIFGDLQIVTVYRSPNGDFQMFMSNMSSVLSSLRNDKPIIILGDFNVHFNTRNADALELCNLFCTFGLSQFVFTNTRGGSCLDNVFSNLDSGALSVRVLDDNVSQISDHLALACGLKLVSDSVRSSATRVNYRPVTDLGLFTLYNLTESTDWNFIFASSWSAEQKFERFVDTLRDYMTSSFPLKTKVINNSPRKKINWFNGELYSMRERLSLLREMCRVSPELVSADDVRSYRRRYRARISHCRQQASDRFVLNSRNPQLAMWDIIKGTASATRATKTNLTAEEFNSFFADAPGNIVDNLPKSNVDPMSFLTHRTLLNFTFREVSFVEVSDVISSLKNSKSGDAYGMSVRVLKTIKNVITSPLTRLINLCIRNATFPKILKVAKVVPIYKKGSVNDASNFRPISVVPVFAKVFEVLMNRQLSAHFELNCLYSTAQFGFRSNLSTTHAVSRLVQMIKDGFEERSHTYALFFDLTKAFDCVSHDILLKKLNYYGFDLNSLSLIKSYLSDRSQYVSHNSLRSSLRSITFGVPQGSALAPTLFLVYINDIVQCNTQSTLILYADDTNLVSKHPDLATLEIESASAGRAVESWFLSNRLCLNVDKTQKILFTLRDTHGAPKSGDSATFLGITIDSKLTWEHHVNTLSSKLSRQLYLIRNLTRHTSTRIVLIAYFSYFHSRLSYSILNWGHSAHTCRIFGLQRKCVRVIRGLGYRESCREHFAMLGILTVPCVYILQCLLYFTEHIESHSRHSDVHTYETRYRGNFLHDYLRLARARDGTNYFCIKFFNVLPLEVRQLDRVHFKTRMKRFLLHKAFYSFEEYLSNDFRDL